MSSGAADTSVRIRYGGETFRKVAEKAERRELMAADADLLALWKRLPHPGAEWADAVEKVTGAQASILDQPAPCER